MRSVLFVCNLNPKKLGTFERYLAEFGWRCRAESVRFGLVLAGEPIREVANLFRDAGIEWWAIPNWNDDSDQERSKCFLASFVPILRRGPWRVAVFQFCHELTIIRALVGARLRGCAPGKSIWIQHSQMVLPGRLARRFSKIRLLAAFVDGMILLSEAGRTAVCARGWSSERATVIRNGIPILDQLKRGWLRSAMGLPSDAVVLICVGTLIPRKGYDILLPALAPLLQSHPLRHFLIVGDGPDKSDLHSLVESLGISRSVHFLGLRNDVPELLADADLFVLASRAEGLTLAVVEAMAAELPVVVTDVGGHREVVSPETGWIVPPGNAIAMRTAISEALEHPNVRELGRASRRLVQRDFSLPGQIEAQYQYFLQVAQSPTGVKSPFDKPRAIGTGDGI